MNLERFKNFLLGEDYAVSTIKKYTNLLEDLEKNQDFDLDEIDDNYKIAEFVHSLDRTRVAKNNISKAINCYMKFKGDDYRLKLKRYKGKKDTWILSEEQKKKLLNVKFKNKWHTERNRLILRVLFETGLRVSDVCSLTYDQIKKRRKKRDEVRYYIAVSEEKGEKNYRVYISKRLYDQIKWYKKHYGHSDFLFETESSKDHLTPKGVRDVCYKASDKTGDQELIDNFSPHKARHYRAKELLHEGLGIKYVRDFLGHENTSTTERYLEENDDFLFKELSSKDKYFESEDKNLEGEKND